MKGMQVYHLVQNEIFHVHTHRCKHAGATPDCEYVEKAIELGARRIVFTDHAPFPGNPFGHRMDMDELQEYIDSISKLKKKYGRVIEICCGLEIEYLPSFDDYYRELKAMDGIDLLVLGQHFYEHSKGVYSFDDEDRSTEYLGLCDAMVQGINTGWFDVVAHPDRAFRRCKVKEFTRSEIDVSKSVIWAAAWNGVYLEKNYLSMNSENQYREEFWKLLPAKAMTLYGLDAHSIEELESGYLYREKMFVRP